MAKEDQERMNLVCEAQQCDENIRDLHRRADHLEFALLLPEAARSIRAAAANLYQATTSIRDRLRNPV